MNDTLEIHQLSCPECTWQGMSDDVKYGRCPWCGTRAKKANIKLKGESDG